MIRVVVVSKKIKNINLSLDIEYIINPDNLMKTLKEECIDCLIFDYYESILDLIVTIKMIKIIDSNLKVIVTIDDLNENIIRLLYDNSVDHILLKPLDVKLLKIFFDKLKIQNNKIDYSANQKLVDILSKLGMPANLRGYSYIKEAVLLSIEDEKYYLHTSTYLYPTLSTKFKSKINNIEKAIRAAIELCWCRGDIDVQEKIFGYTVDKNKGRPTNSEFIAQLLNYLKAY